MNATAQPPDHPVAVACARAGVSPTLVVQRSRGWEKVREEGRCRMCQRPSSVRPLSRHHVVPQAWFRAHPKVAPIRHADANIVPLCDPCHRAVEERGSHARIELRRLLDTTEVAFVIQLRGTDWMNTRYPSSGTVKRPPVLLEFPLRPRLIHARECDGDVGCVDSCPVWIERGIYTSRRRSEARRPYP